MAVSLEVKGLDKIIKTIDNYTKSLNGRMETFVERLMNVGIPVIDQNYTKSMSRVTTEDYSLQHSTRVEVKNEGEYISATLYVEGEDLAFIEFGAGIYFHTQDHPKASELGMGVGTYPNQTHAFDDFWWYIGEDGVKHFSRGTGASMPIFKASEEMQRQFLTIAKEVFGV